MSLICRQLIDNQEMLIFARQDFLLHRLYTIRIDNNDLCLRPNYSQSFFTRSVTDGVSHTRDIEKELLRPDSFEHAEWSYDIDTFDFLR